MARWRSATTTSEACGSPRRRSSAGNPEGDRWLLGTFAGHLETEDGILEEFEGLSAEAAVAWGRARAARVLRLGDGGEHFSAGTKTLPGEAPWPTANGTLGRRRPTGEGWKERTDRDAPIPWIVPVELQPDAPAAVTADDRARAEKLTAEAAGVPAPEPPAPPARGFTYRPVRAIPLRVDATTREEAIAAAIRTCPSPPGWTARPIVHAVRPAGAATAGPEASGRPPPKR